MDKDKVIKVLNAALEHEMSSMVRYLHHSFIVAGPERGPLVELFRARVNDSAQHAISLGDKITALGGHPSVKITQIYEPGDQTLTEMLKEDLEVEKEHVDLYEDLLKEVGDNTAMKVYLENFVCEEQQHVDELAMYLRGAE
jgi:bacterioferritin